MKPLTCAVCGSHLKESVGWWSHQRLGKAWCWGLHSMAEITAALGEDVTGHTLMFRVPVGITAQDDDLERIRAKAVEDQ